MGAESGSDPDIHEVFERSIAAEYAYFTPRGEPLCWPVTPYWDPTSAVISISTGLAYPNKAVYAKRNEKVAILFSHPTGSDVHNFQPVLVRGDATVRDDDIQHNTDRYVTELRRKFSSARLAINPLTVKLLDFYLPRLWVEIPTTDLRVGMLQAPVGQATPAHEGIRTTLTSADADALIKVVRSMAEGVVVVKDDDGYPFCQRMALLPMSDGSVELEHRLPEGPAALSLHRHTLGGTRFKAWMARGAISHHEGMVVFHPTRIVGFFGNGAIFPLSLVPRIGGLRSRLRRELRERGQPMPKLRVPG